MTIAAIIVAAGRGTRAGAPGPKQWQPLGGQRVADWSVAAFAGHPDVRRVLLVIHPDDRSQADTLAEQTGAQVILGGATRAASVLAGLEALDGSDTARVLIHDVARPGISGDVIDRVLAALDTHPGAAPALAATDALWRGAEGLVAGVQDRDGLWRAQTPQGFAFPAILHAHRAHPGGAADDVAVARHAGLDVAIVDGDEDNLKITHPQDFTRAERSLGHRMDIRTGNGFDVHRFEDGDHVTLCGIDIPHTRKLKGHSDADVGMHAVTDALYGALADGDIGQHFPPSDSQWKGAASRIFLAHAARRVADAGFALTHVDCTLICERPKIGPHARAMRQALADILGIDMGRVSVKATTSEKLGFTGREEGIAAMATATIVKS